MFAFKKNLKFKIFFAIKLINQKHETQCNFHITIPRTARAYSAR